jgi:hypothetical protein
LCSAALAKLRKLPRCLPLCIEYACRLDRPIFLSWYCELLRGRSSQAQSAHQASVGARWVTSGEPGSRLAAGVCSYKSQAMIAARHGSIRCLEWLFRRGSYDRYRVLCHAVRHQVSTRVKQWFLQEHGGGMPARHGWCASEVLNCWKFKERTRMATPQSFPAELLNFESSAYRLSEDAISYLRELLSHRLRHALMLSKAPGVRFLRSPLSLSPGPCNRLLLQLESLQGQMIELTLWCGASQELMVELREKNAYPRALRSFTLPQQEDALLDGLRCLLRAKD